MKKLCRVLMIFFLSLTMINIINAEDDDEEEKTSHFIYDWKNTGEVTVYLLSIKSLEGRNLKNGEFTFELLNENGDVLQTKTNDANGIIMWDVFKLNDEDRARLLNNDETIIFKVREVKGDDTSIVYDENVYTYELNMHETCEYCGGTGVVYEYFTLSFIPEPLITDRSGLPERPGPHGYESLLTNRYTYSLVRTSNPYDEGDYTATDLKMESVGGYWGQNDLDVWSTIEYFYIFENPTSNIWILDEEYANETIEDYENRILNDLNVTRYRRPNGTTGMLFNAFSDSYTEQAYVDFEGITYNNIYKKWTNEHICGRCLGDGVVVTDGTLPDPTFKNTLKEVPPTPTPTPSVPPKTTPPTVPNTAVK